MKFTERRRFVRLDASIQVGYKVLKKGRRTKSLTRNVSGGGIRFSVGEKLGIDSVLQLEIRVPNYPDPISAVGIVVWSKALEVGVKFSKIDLVDQARLFKYVYEHIY